MVRGLRAHEIVEWAGLAKLKDQLEIGENLLKLVYRLIFTVYTVNGSSVNLPALASVTEWAIAKALKKCENDSESFGTVYNNFKTSVQNIKAVKKPGKNVDQLSNGERKKLLAEIDSLKRKAAQEPRPYYPNFNGRGGFRDRGRGRGRGRGAGGRWRRF